ncbi:hypothetical protein OIU78_022237 [Salix suchowensis]|nr:hypothetical protein OIU78_022237 [Salix suchowensis]
MATSRFHQALGTAQSHQHLQNSGSHHEFGNASLKLISKAFKADVGLSIRGGYNSCMRKSGVIQASTSQTSVQSVSYSPNNSSDELRRKSSEAALILIRHGESLWNEKNLFHRLTVAKRFLSFYTMRMNRQGEWSRIFSEDTKKQSIPVVTAWQLNERMYGELQGLNKQETADRFGKEKVHEWRRSYDIPPPNGESLEMCAERAVAYFKDHIEPQLLSGKNVMIAAHGNSLRSIIMYLDKLTSQEVINLELSTGIPMLYIFKGGKFIRRGSPAGPTEAGVYAYTRACDFWTSY